MLAAVFSVMKMSEFYEKYWRIQLPNGETVTPKLDDKERQIMDKAEELGVLPYVRVWKRKQGWCYIVHPEIEAAL